MRTSKILALVFGMLLGSLVPAGAETVEVLSLTNNSQPGPAYFPAVSADGKWAAFSLYADPTRLTNHYYEIYVRNLATGTLELISVANDGGVANGVSQRPVLSVDGRFVVFESYASNLVPDDVNGTVDVFLRDRLLGTTEIVSVATDGTQGIYGSSAAAVSADGRFVAFCTRSNFTSNNSMVFGTYLRDRQARTTTFVSTGIFPALSGDGRVVVTRDNGLVLRDLQTGAVETIAQFTFGLMNTNPNAYIPAISGDGRYVVFEGWSAAGAPLSTEVFVYDRLTRTTRQITRAFDGSPLTTATTPYGTSLRPKISADGRFVLFFSSAADLVEGITDKQLYLHDLVNQTTTRVPVDNLWATVLYPLFDLSGDGSVIVFQDTITNHFPQYPTAYYFGIFTLRSNATIGEDTDTGEGNGIGLAEPKITAEPSVLWPPNSKLTDVKLAVAAPGATAVEIRVADEYGTFNQTVHGTEAKVKLEAWRNGADQDGRTYTITAVATNAAGQTRTTTTTVSVPHDQR